MPISNQDIPNSVQNLNSLAISIATWDTGALTNLNIGLNSLQRNCSDRTSTLLPMNETRLLDEESLREEGGGYNF